MAITPVKDISHSYGETSSRHRNSRRPRARQGVRWWRIAASSPNLTVVTLLWVATLLLGGSSRPDVVQIILLRPLAVLAAAYGFWTLQRSHISGHRFLVAMVAAIFLLTAIHLIPLPASLWTALPGRELIAGLDHQMGMDGVWRPISMAPAFTWNALFSLTVPLAFLVNGIQLGREELERLVVVVIAGGIASAALALLQMFDSSNGTLHFYSSRVTEAVGFFANRNHQALLIAAMFPLLAGYGAKWGAEPTDNQRRFIVASALSTFLLPLLIVTGSRAGLVVGVCGLAVSPFIYLQGARVRRSRKMSPMWWKYLIGMVFVAAIAGLSIVTGRSIAIERALSSYSEQDQRYDFWSAIIANYDRFMPIGSGIGSYQPVYQTFEPRGALSSSYSNHAHNDWLEIVMTAGVPGGFLLLVAILAFGLAVWRHFRINERGARAAYRLAGLTIILLVAMASLLDYPVRAPIISSLLVMSCLWADAGCRRERAGTGGVRPS